MIQTPAHKQTDPSKAPGVIKTLGDYVTQVQVKEAPPYPTGYVPKQPKTWSVPVQMGGGYEYGEKIFDSKEEMEQWVASRKQQHAFVPPIKIEDPKAGIGDINSNEKGSGARYNAGKAPFDLIPLRVVADHYEALQERSGVNEEDTFQAYQEVEALLCLRRLALWQETGAPAELTGALSELGDCWTECAQVFDYGRKKYAEWNWAKGMKWSAPLACATRHLKQILDGEELDAESGLPHRGHVYCNLVMLLTYIRTYPEGDDRPRCLVAC